MFSLFAKNNIVSGTSSDDRAENRALTRAQNFETISLFVFFVVSVSVLSFFLSSVAKAQTTALANDPATLAASAEEKATPRKFIWTGQVVFETTRSADESKPASYAGWYMASGSATHKEYALTTTARVGYAQEYTYRRDDGSNGSFDNPSLSVAKSFLNGRDFNLSWLDSVSVSLNGTIGANQESARRTFLWSNGATVTAGKSFGRALLRQSFGYTHSFFDYDIRDDGTVNSPDSVRSLTMLYYDISDRLSIGGSFTYGYSISFQGVGRATTMAQASADYMIAPEISASVGVASERGTLEPDGQTNRIRFYAPESAQYFVDLIVLL